LSLLEDLQKEHWPAFVRWRNGPIWVAVAGVLFFLGSQAYDAWWEAALTQTRCTVVSAKVGGEIVVSPGTRSSRRRATGRWVEHIEVVFQVEGGARRYSVQNRMDLQAGQVLDCWLTAEDVHLDPTWELSRSRAGAMSVGAMFIGVGFMWWLWRALKQL
jgi:hypothetical protein